MPAMTDLRSEPVFYAPTPERIQVGDLDIHLYGSRVFLCGVQIELSPKEFEILFSLARARGRVCSRKQLQADLYGDNKPTTTRSLDFHIHSLRVKLGSFDSIVTIHSIGFKLAVRGSAG
jgi:two-component system response regulator ResD